MAQPVQHQFLYPDRVQTNTLNEQMQRELLALYQRSDELLRELTTVRQRMDELHSAMGGVDITLQALKDSLVIRPGGRSPFSLADAE